jgi:hypothetical protein
MDNEIEDRNNCAGKGQQQFNQKAFSAATV